MGNEITSQAEPRKQHLDEAMVCQMRALIRELWPDEFAGKPELTLIQGGRTS